MMSFESLVIGAGIIAILFAFWKTNWISKQDQGTEKMKRIGTNIADGAMSFLKAEYRVLAVFVLAVAILLGIANAGNPESSYFIALSFLTGALASGLAEAGADIAVLGHRRDVLEECITSASRPGMQVHEFLVDLKDADAVKEVIKDVIGVFGKIDALVNDTQVEFAKPIVDITSDE